MTKPYCGIESKVPKGYHRATMQECIDNKQVRYYGLHKIDKRLLEAPKQKKVSNKDREKQISKLIIVKAKVKKLKEKIEDTDDVDEKAVLKDQLKALKKEGVEISDNLKETNKSLEKPKAVKKVSKIKGKKTVDRDQYKYDESTDSFLINNSELKPKIDSFDIMEYRAKQKEAKKWADMKADVLKHDPNCEKMSALEQGWAWNRAQLRKSAIDIPLMKKSLQDSIAKLRKSEEALGKKSPKIKKLI